MSTIRLWIDSQEVEAKPAQTIMEAADSAGVYIPRLCFHPSLKPSGSCRLCAVEIDGQRGLPAACSTEVTEGMRVMTATAKVQEFRREMLRLILQDHPRECLGCPRNGTCELQQLVTMVGIDFSYPPPTEKRPPASLCGAYFERDNTLCVRCGRCVRACHEIRGAKVIMFRERAGKPEVGTPFDRSMEDTGCQFCGACVDVCPVGALRERLDTYQGATRQHVMEVCEGLANIVTSLYRSEIPSDWKSSICPMCASGCSLNFEITDSQDIVQVKPEAAGPSNSGQACVQGRFLLKKYLKSDDRLKVPQVRENGGFKSVAWGDALDRVAAKFKSYGPGETAVLTDGRLTNAELFGLQQFARTVLKTEQVAALSPKGHGVLADVFHKNFGAVANTLKLGDLKHAGCMLAFGVNPAASYPLASPYIREASLNGVKLIALSPCNVGISRFADMHLHYYPGTEEILVGGFIAMMLDQNRVDPAFAAQYPKELEALKAALADYSPEHVGHATGIHHELLVDVGCLLAKEPALAVLLGLGSLQSGKLGQVLQGLITLLQVTGSFGKPGGGMATLYGNGNSQGAMEMGVCPSVLPGQAVQGGAPGSDADVLEAIEGGKIKGLFLAMEGLEGSCFSAVEPLLGKLDYVVLQDVAAPAKPLGDVLLPMASILEKGGTLTNGERLVQQAEPVLDAPGEAQSLLWVLGELAGRMGAQGFDAATLEAGASDAVGKIAPLSSSKPAYVSWQPSMGFDGTEHPDEEYPYALIIKEPVRDFYQGPLLAGETSGQFGSNDDLEMNPADAFSTGFRPGDMVKVSTRKGDWTAKLVMNRLLPRKMVFVPGAAAQSHLGNPAGEGRIFAAKVEKG